MGSAILDNQTLKSLRNNFTDDVDRGAAPRSGSGNPARSPAAERARREAEERRSKRDRDAARPAAEVGGRGGQDPARYGDWEKDGIASDF
jgi:hypothetical protein